MSRVREFFAAPFPWGRFLGDFGTFGVAPMFFGAVGAYGAWTHRLDYVLVSAVTLAIFWPLTGLLLALLRIYQIDAAETIDELCAHIDLLDPPA